jgi:hypothetical protein
LPAVPPTVYLTTSGWPITPVTRSTTNVAGSRPASAADASVTYSVTFGRSSSAIVAVADGLLPTTYAALPMRLRTTVSGSSSTSSSIGVTVIVAEAWPAGIVTDPASAA